MNLYKAIKTAERVGREVQIFMICFRNVFSENGKCGKLYNIRDAKEGLFDEEHQKSVPAMSSKSLDLILNVVVRMSVKVLGAPENLIRTFEVVPG